MKDIEKIANTYIDTPHINCGNIKGVGLDCCSLITNIYKECNIIDISINFNYTYDWYLKNNCKEILYEYLEKYFNEIKESDLKAGDIIALSYGRAKYAHLVMYLDKNKYIHCSVDNGTEIITKDNYIFFDKKNNSRITGYFTLKKDVS